MIFWIFPPPFTPQWNTSTMICTFLRDPLLLSWNSKTNTTIQKPREILIRSRVKNILINTPILYLKTWFSTGREIHCKLEIHRVNPKYLWGFTFPIWSALDLLCWVYHKYSPLSWKHIIYYFLLMFLSSPFSSPGTTKWSEARICIFVAEEMVVLEGAAGALPENDKSQLSELGLLDLSRSKLRWLWLEIN